MAEKLEQGNYYLIYESNHYNNIQEIKIERETERCVFVKFLHPNQKNKWIRKIHFEGVVVPIYNIIEKLDPKFYRQKKLERIIK